MQMFVWWRKPISFISYKHKNPLSTIRTMRSAHAHDVADSVAAVQFTKLKW